MGVKKDVNSKTGREGWGAEEGDGEGMTLWFRGVGGEIVVWHRDVYDYSLPLEREG